MVTGMARGWLVCCRRDRDAVDVGPRLGPGQRGRHLAHPVASPEVTPAPGWSRRRATRATERGVALLG